MTDKEWLRNILKKQEEKDKKADFFVCTDFVFEDILEDKKCQK